MQNGGGRVQKSFQMHFSTQHHCLTIPTSSLAWMYSSRATKVPSLQLILVHSISCMSSELNSKLPMILRRLLKPFLDFIVPWFQYQSPNSSKLLFRYEWKGFTSELMLMWSTEPDMSSGSLTGACHGCTLEISHRSLPES